MTEPRFTLASKGIFRIARCTDYGTAPGFLQAGEREDLPHPSCYPTGLMTASSPRPEGGGRLLLEHRHAHASLDAGDEILVAPV